MPIRINLLNETLAEEDMRRRDPVKLAAFIGFFLIAVSLMWLSSAWLEFKLTQQKKEQVDIEIATHTNEYSQVQVSLKKIAEGQRRLDALQQLNTNRFLQGNLLNALQQTCVPHVQLTRLRLDQSFIFKEGTPAKTNDSGVVVAGRPGASTQHATLTLDAKDTSPNPGDQWKIYKEALARQDFFKSCLDATSGVKLTTQSSPQSGVDGKFYVQFTLECRFSDKTR
jgi:hypothetical protein